MLKLNHLTGFGSGAAAAAGTPTSYAFGGAASDQLIIPDHADWDIVANANDMTIDMWIFFSGAPSGGQCLLGQFEDSNNYWRLFHTGGSSLRLQVNSGGSTIIDTSAGASSFAATTWHHVAVCKVGTEYGIYADGTQVAFVDDASTDSFTGDLVFGGHSDVGGDWFPGRFDEMRIYHGNPFSAAPNSTPNDTIIVPTAEHTSDANTKLLIHGGEAYTAPLTGETTAPCYVFDGTSDQLSLPDHADWDLFADTNNATIDLWVNFSATNGKDFIGQYEGAQEFWRIYTTIGTLKFDLFDGSQVFQCADTHTFVADTWHHVALCKVGIEYGLYIDGTQIAYVSDAGTATFTGGLFFGGHTHVGGDWYDGKMAEMRIYDGNPFTAAPNATPDDTIIVPTERHTSDANTLLLIHGDEAKSGTTGSGLTFTDSGNTGHTITENGNAIRANGGTFVDSGNTGHTVIENGNAMRGIEKEYKIDPDAVGYFFNGTTDYLSVPDHSDFNHGTSNFTWEAWVMTPDAFPSATMGIMGQWDDSSNFVRLHLADPNTRYNFTVNIGGGMQVNFNPYGNFKPNTWHHIAIVRDTGNLWHLFFDGTSVANDTISVTMPNLSGDFWIGRSISTNYWNGWIDEVRVSDIARYPSGTPFTPSTTQFTSDANTVLLIHCGETKTGTTGSGATFTDSGNTGHTVTENGNAIESTGNLYKF